MYFLIINTNNAPKSSSVISISPAGVVFKEGTAISIDMFLEQNGVKAYGTNCSYEEKSSPIILIIPENQK